MEALLLTGKYIVPFTPVAVKETFTLPGTGLTRSQTAFGYNHDTGKLIMVNGNGGGTVSGVQYPTTAVRANIDGSGQTTAAMGSTATWMYGGCQVGDDLYINDGQDGTYNSKFRKISISGTTGPVSLAALQQPYRHSSPLISYANNTKLFRAFGYSGSASIPDCHSYDIASNIWTAMTPAPIPMHGVHGVHYQGKIYFPGGWSSQNGRSYPYITIYNVATNSWTRSDAEIDSKLFPTGPGKSIFVWVSSVLVGDTIWTFTRAGDSEFLPEGSDPNTMVIVKYSITNDSFSYGIPNVKQRFMSGNVYIPSRNEIRMYGGTDLHSGQSGYGDSYPRLPNCLVLSTI